MARKELKVEELVEVLYQWHRGRNVSQIKQSLGLDRKTIRKYIEQAEGYRFVREDEPRDYRYYLELASRLQAGLKTPLRKYGVNLDNLLNDGASGEREFQPAGQAVTPLTRISISFGNP